MVENLAENEVCVWHASLDTAESHDELEGLLSGEERSRADSFRFRRDRRRYVAAHGTLRVILSRYLGVTPSMLCFEGRTYGKPAIRQGMNPAGIEFNMSTSAGHSLYAVTRRCDVGVDVEQVRNVPEMDEIVAKFFSRAEQVEFATLRVAERTQGFFNCWTRKEAVVKALGYGLRIPLDSFGVSLTPGQSPRLVEADRGMGTPAGWCVCHVDPEPGVVGAVAVRRREVSVTLRKLSAGRLRR